MTSKDYAKLAIKIREEHSNKMTPQIDTYLKVLETPRISSKIKAKYADLIEGMIK